MTERTLDHVGIAVHSLDPAIAFWTSCLATSVVERDVVEDQGVEVAFIGTGPGRIELLAPVGPESAVARFLERRGPGLHHICFRVPDLRAALDEILASGREVIDPAPSRGAFGHLIAFIHPDSADGVLTELLQVD